MKLACETQRSDRLEIEVRYRWVFGRARQIDKCLAPSFRIQRSDRILGVTPFRFAAPLVQSGRHLPPVVDVG